MANNFGKAKETWILYNAASMVITAIETEIIDGGFPVFVDENLDVDGENYDRLMIIPPDFDKHIDDYESYPQFLFEDCAFLPPIKEHCDTLDHLPQPMEMLELLEICRRKFSDKMFAALGEMKNITKGGYDAVYKAEKDAS